MGKEWWEETPEEFVAGFSEEVQVHTSLPPALTQHQAERAIQEYTRLMEAGPLPENEQALQALIEQVSTHGFYFNYDRNVQAYRLVSSKESE